MVRETFCEDCEYFDREDERRGDCRRHAPQVVVVDECAHTVWPTVRGEYEWCGEFKPKAAK